jgi:hypothetical protein
VVVVATVETEVDVSVVAVSAVVVVRVAFGATTRLIWALLKVMVAVSVVPGQLTVTLVWLGEFSTSACAFPIVESTDSLPDVGLIRIRKATLPLGQAPLRRSS